MSKPMGRVHSVTIHHSASPLWTTFDDIDKWHKDRGWDGCGYHFIVEKGGNIVSGRPISIEGAHVKSKNSGNIGVCVVGNNTSSAKEQHWTRAQKASLRFLCSTLQLIFNLDDSCVFNHSDWDSANTECPGVDISSIF